MDIADIPLGYIHVSHEHHHTYEVSDSHTEVGGEEHLCTRCQPFCTVCGKLRPDNTGMDGANDNDANNGHSVQGNARNDHSIQGNAHNGHSIQAHASGSRSTNPRADEDDVDAITPAPARYPFEMPYPRSHPANNDATRYTRAPPSLDSHLGYQRQGTPAPSDHMVPMGTLYMSSPPSSDNGRLVMLSPNAASAPSDRTLLRGSNRARRANRSTDRVSELQIGWMDYVRYTLSTRRATLILTAVISTFVLGLMVFLSVLTFGPSRNNPSKRDVVVFGGQVSAVHDVDMGINHTRASTHSAFSSFLAPNYRAFDAVSTSPGQLCDLVCGLGTFGKCCEPSSPSLSPFCVGENDTCCGDGFCTSEETCCNGFCGPELAKCTTAGSVPTTSNPSAPVTSASSAFSSLVTSRALPSPAPAATSYAYSAPGITTVRSGAGRARGAVPGVLPGWDVGGGRWLLFGGVCLLLAAVWLLPVRLFGGDGGDGEEEEEEEK